MNREWCRYWDAVVVSASEFRAVEEGTHYQ